MDLNKSIWFKLSILLTTIFTVNFSCIANASQVWSAKNLETKNIPKIEYYNGMYVMAADSIYTSKGGETWESTLSPDVNGNYNEVYVLNDEFIVTGENVQPVKSSYGRDWTSLRLHNNISPKDIKLMDKVYFGTDSKGNLFYSKNLLTWDDVPMPKGGKLINKSFANNKCFVSVVSDTDIPDYWLIDSNLNMNQIDASIHSIDNISYLPETKTYINIISVGSTSSKRLYTLISKDGITWDKNDLILDKYQKETLKADEFNLISQGGKVFLNIKNDTYITSDGVNWTKIKNYGNIKDLKYSGEYLYNINNSTTVFISKDGIIWNDYSLPNKINPLSSISILGNRLFVINNNLNDSTNLYDSTVYSHPINSFDEDIDDIAEDSNIIQETTEIETQENTESAISPKIFETPEHERLNTLKLQVGSTKMQLTDGSVVDVESPLIIKDGKVLIPLRTIITALGGSLAWDSKAEKITLYYNNNIIQLWLNSTQAVVNGETIILPIPFENIDNRAMVVAKPIIESLGCTIEWIDDERGILIRY